jgi:tRNA pseudouridine synthase 10
MSKNFLDSSEILDKARILLGKYPLCDSCLGRCFARLGYSLSNADRGKSIKIALLLQIDQEIKDHKIEDLNDVKEIFFNIGDYAEPLFKNYFSDEFQKRSCYLCNSEIDEIKNDFMEKSLSLLEKLGKVKYVLGVRLSEDLKIRENSFSLDNGILYYESIKNEIKRDIGKTLSSKGYPPEIDNPDIEIIYDMDTRQIYTISKKYKVLYVYNRLSRGIPLSTWSEENKSLQNKLDKNIIIPFSEPSEVRIFDNYLIVIEDEKRDEIELCGYIIKKVKETSGREMSIVTQSLPTKRLYRVTVYSSKEIENSKQIYENIRDVFVEAKNFEDLQQKLKNLDGEILSIDLISSEGRHKKIADYLNNSNKDTL